VNVEQKGSPFMPDESGTDKNGVVVEILPWHANVPPAPVNHLTPTY